MRRRGLETIGFPPVFDYCGLTEAGSVLFEDLGEPRPEHHHLGDEAFAGIRSAAREAVDRENVVEERDELGEGGVESLVAYPTENLKLTAALSALKVRRIPKTAGELEPRA